MGLARSAADLPGLLGLCDLGGEPVTPEAFLFFVRQYVAEHPEVAAHVADQARIGLQEALSKAYERAADMEVALVAATAKRLNNANNVIVEKLEKWKGKTACRWDDFVAELKK